MADVVVVGGGPAGSAAAITLARSGRDVVLVDKARFPRDKCCGDGLTTGALRRLDALGLRVGAVESWFEVADVCVRSPSGRSYVFPLPAGARPGVFGAVARRYDLDSALLDVARDAGVKVHDGHALAGARVLDDRVVVDVDGIGEVQARYAVGADGMWSPLRKALTPAAAVTESPYLGEWHAFRQYFTGVESTHLWVWFDPDLLPGYAWSFPLPDGRANIGFGIPRRRGESVQAMKQQWAELLERPHVRDIIGRRATAEAPHKAWPIPADPRSGDVFVAGSGRVLFAGDAARAADPLTGEGIGQALETGTLAGQAIVTAGPNRPAVAASTYERAVTTTLVRDNRLAAALSRAIAHRKGAGAALAMAASTAWTRRNFARWLFEDYPRAVLATPSRWPELAGRTGAFS